MANKRETAERGLHDQTQVLAQKELIFAFCILSLSLLVGFIDQNGISVLLPSISRDLHAEDTIAWAGTSQLIANTVFQVLYGRLSDLFGRKNMLVSALVLLCLSDLACGLAVNSTMFYVFRGLAGVANGGITSLSMMIVSDLVTLKQRGKYQGILGVQVGLGNTFGPLIAAGFDLHLTWRGFFYLLAPLVLVVAFFNWKYLPTNMPKVQLKETLEKIDWYGLVLGTASIILLLIGVSQGGHDGTPWDSPEIISMLTVGGICFLAFLLVEWKQAKLPMMPLDMFKKPSTAAMLAQSFLLGDCYYSYIYFLPLYFQNVRGATPLLSACLVVALFVMQSISSTLAGLSMSWFDMYMPQIAFGFSCWTLGAGLLTMVGEKTSLGLIVLYLIIIGLGTGCVFQPTLVALQAHLPSNQRAVVTSNRNFLRSAGGAVGLAISSAIQANVLKSSLPARLSAVANSSFAAPKLSAFPAADRAIIGSAYAQASRAVFIYCVPVIGICLLLCAFVKDNGLQREEEKVSATPPSEQDEEAAQAATAIEKDHTEQDEKEAVSSTHREPEADLSLGSESTDVSRKPSLSSEKSRL